MWRRRTTQSRRPPASYGQRRAALVLVRQGRAEDRAEDEEPEYADHYPDNERG